MAVTVGAYLDAPLFVEHLMQLTFISSMIREKGMIYDCKKKQRNEPSPLLLAGVRSGLKLGCVAGTLRAAEDAQMSAGGARWF